MEKQLILESSPINELYEYMEIQLAWKPITNKNGVFISKEILEEALNSERNKELFKTGRFRIEFPYDTSKCIMTQSCMRMDKQIGSVLSIDLDKRIAKVRILKDKFNKEIIENYLLAFNYINNSERYNSSDGKVNNLLVMKCGLILKENSVYNIEA